MNHPTYTYIFKASDYIKIGVTTDILRRHENINRDCPHEIKILRTFGPFERKFAYNLELYLHLLCKDHNYKNEWFVFSDDLLERIDKATEDKTTGDIEKMIREIKIDERRI